MIRLRSLYNVIGLTLPFCVSMLMFPAWLLAQSMPESVPSNKDVRKNVSVISVPMLHPGIDINDGRLALELLMKKRLLLQVHLDFLENASQIEAPSILENYHLLALSGEDLASKGSSISLAPMLILSKHDEPTEKFLLVMPADFQLEDLSKRKKRVLMIDQGRSIGQTALIWLDTILWKSGYPKSDVFFTSIEKASKTSQVLLPVFFGKADACVITHSAFELMSEFNPQIKKRLAIREISPGLVTLLVCATDLASPELREFIIAEAQEVERDHDPSVQQAMTIIRMKRFIPFQPEYFQATKALVREHRELAFKQLGNQ
jgi:hypothetical protein